MNCCSGEVYSATTKIEELLITQSKLVDTLQEYITTTESKLKTLKVYLENLKKEQEKASKDVEEYLGNPINDFLLIKRLTHDWKDVEDLIMDNTSSGKEFRNGKTNHNRIRTLPLVSLVCSIRQL